MLEKLVFVFLFVSFHLAVSQVVVDKCPADLGVATIKQASIDDIISEAVLLDSSHPCGGGLWKMVANLNMSDPFQQCPSGWREYPNNESISVRSCGRPVNSNGDCFSTFLKTENFEYSQVCGRVIGYQVNSPDAFLSLESDHNNISNPYVDGISLTHGNNPRKHIWTFAAGSNEYGDKFGCPCGKQSNAAMNAPAFVADNFFCESARDEPSFRSNSGFFANDTLWDGKKCAISSCCDLNNPPWFIAKLETPTSDDIELRLCMDQEESDEDVTIELWEIYVQ